MRKNKGTLMKSFAQGQEPELKPRKLNPKPLLNQSHWFTYMKTYVKTNYKDWPQFNELSWGTY